MPVPRDFCLALFAGLAVLSLARANLSCSSLGNGCVEHQSKDGVKRCCKRVTCNPGEYAILCDTDNCAAIRCQACPEWAYMPYSTDSVHMETCRRKTPCSRRQNKVVDDEGSTTTDQTCKCDLNNGYVSVPDGSSDTCVGPIKCEPGYELNIDGECIKCHYSKFKPEHGTGRCQQKTDCGGPEMYEFFADHDLTKDNICLNITAPPVPPTTPITVVVKTDDDLSTGPNLTPIIVGAAVGFVAMVCIIVIVVVLLLKRRREYDTDSEADSDVKRGAPDNWDSETGSESSDGRTSHDNPRVQLLNKDKPRPPQPGKVITEKPRVHIPPPGQDRGKTNVITPDSGIVDLPLDPNKNSGPTPSPVRKDLTQLQTQNSDMSTGTVINVVGDNCKVYVGDQITQVHEERADYNDEDNGNNDTDYEVREES